MFGHTVLLRLDCSSDECTRSKTASCKAVMTYKTSLVYCEEDLNYVLVRVLKNNQNQSLLTTTSSCDYLIATAAMFSNHNLANYTKSFISVQEIHSAPVREGISAQIWFCYVHQVIHSAPVKEGISAPKIRIMMLTTA